MNKQDITELIDHFYNKDILVELFKQYFSTWIQRGIVTSPISPNATTPDLQHIGKQAYIDILQQFYTDDTVCKSVYNLLPKTIQKAVVTISLRESCPALEFEKIIGEKVVVRDRNSYYSQSGEAKTVLSPYRLFLRYHGREDWAYSFRDSHDSEPKGEVYFSIQLCQLLRKHLPKQPDYYLNPVTTVSTTFTHDASKETVEQIALYEAYVQDGNLQLTSRLMVPSVSGLKSMQKYCQISEFYQTKELAFIKTSLIASVLYYSKISKNQQEKPYEIVKKLISNFLKNPMELPLDAMLLSHLKGWEVPTREKYLGNSLRKVLTDLPKDKWVSLENIIAYTQYQELPFDYYDSRWNVERSIYVTKRSEYYRERLYLNGHHYHNFFTIPFIKGLFFLLAAFGIVAISYELPQKNEEIVSKNYYLTPFDGLQYVSLTQLGRYVLGIDETFQGEITVTTGKVLLDTFSLIATVSGENKIIRLTLDKMGTKLDENRYEITYESLFKECEKLSDVQRKIESFKQYISSNPPPVWEMFFKSAVTQINPVKKENDYVVLKLKNSQQLITLVATDEKLKPYIIKAEGYRILVKRELLSLVLTRLAQLGYFTTK